jgi:hypothetical protein
MISENRLYALIGTLLFNTNCHIYLSVRYGSMRTKPINKIEMG